MVHVITPPPTDVSRNNIIWLAGPRLIGILFNWSLLGVLTTQVYIYYLNFPKDLKWHKVLVYIVYLLDWAQTCSATYDAFHWFVYGWGSIDALYDLYSTFLNVPILSSVIAAIVQAFFAWRIWRLTQSRIISILIILLALLQLGGGIAVGIFVWRDSSEVARSDGLVSAVGVRLAGSAFADTVIAISMTYFLLRSKSQVMGHMNNVVTRLIRLTIETGTMTAIAAIVDLVFFLKATNGLHQVSGVILCKLYSNSLLVLFNNRMIVTSSKKDQTHFLSNSSGTNTSEGESSRELETFKAAVPRVSTLDLDGGISVSTKGEWRSRSQIEAIPLDDFT
ncbi:uncharacterized protein C8R40DRAFT_43831 [Lentinula edodes]|uniref:uncharacterized protein n=1 Tax=Lentinula edodes TaxID=5353 RepID=UPI001E8DABBE|nr:uncharacterized protein C8R40DRAFT_43831 [Lentinula edodes]KAH7881453.1 hypothetical protein C8R40DRAFT_43831 [Lentinula edodes]